MPRSSFPGHFLFIDLAMARNAAQHALMLEERLNLMRLEMRKAYREVVNEQYEAAKELTSGTTKTRELVAMGHPYARRQRMKRKGSGKFSKGKKAKNIPINKQTGLLQNSLTLKGIMMPGYSVAYDLYFADTSGDHRWVLAPSGTKRMRARGFWKELKKRYKYSVLISRRAYRAKADAIKRAT